MQIGLIASLEAFFRVLPIVILLGLVVFFWRAWKRYIASYFISKLDWVLVEVTLPKETFKSPRAMEVVLGAFHQAPGINILEQYYLGNVRPWSSLEIASINGHVHFFIRILKKYRVAVETHIYSQYPTAEIHEVSDYVYGVPYLKKDSGWQLFGTEFKFTKEDAYPIKTYVDYGLDKDPKEEFKVDPMTSALEFMGSVGPGEQVWFQILIMAAQKRFRKPGTYLEMQDWVGDSKALLDKLMKRDKLKDAVMLSNEILLSPGERSIVEAIERQISKMGFDCGIRIVYLAEKDKFNPANISGLMSVVKQYNSLNLNGFKPARYTSYDPWQDPFGKKLPKAKEAIFEAYCNRGWFYPPYSRLPFVLNTEELATIYHFPGAVAATPTFARAESKRGEAPVNLPI
ncbi:MAG: hypothetical protein HY226_03680 [Candidatus Vogelbacteria bacterium]|nr:hypothetical protein [Candidatus Vogelbacteria bacterium]